jgi:hypothetical protein
VHSAFATEEALPSSELKIASWDLTGATLPAPPPKPDFRPPPERQQTWRTTFGSERRPAEPQAIKGTVVIDADVVLLQGLTDIVAVRRVFPAWHWRLIVSRRALSARLPREAGLTRVPPDTPVTAIAVRARRGLRISARDELRELHDIEADLGHKPTAVTAARIADGTRTLWFVSVMLADACTGAQGTCPARDYLSSWRRRKREGGEPTVAGGRLSTASGTVSPGPCQRQMIEADSKGAFGPPLGATGAPRGDTGCVAVLDLPP